MDCLCVIVNNCGFFLILFQFILHIPYLIYAISCLFVTSLSSFHMIGHQLSIFFSIILVSKQ